jgi:hypothetical protein
VSIAFPIPLQLRGERHFRNAAAGSANFSRVDFPGDASMGRRTGVDRLEVGGRVVAPSSIHGLKLCR